MGVTYPQLYTLVQRGLIACTKKERSKGIWLSDVEVKKANAILGCGKVREGPDRKKIARQIRILLQAKKKLSSTNKGLSTALGVKETTLKSYLYGRTLCPPTILELAKSLISS